MSAEELNEYHVAIYQPSWSDTRRIVASDAAEPPVSEKDLSND